MRLQVISAKPLIEGLLTFLPGLKDLLNKSTGGTDSASYCYTVWLRHYVKIVQTLNTDLTASHIAEFGPGDSLGTGIAALLSGCERYTAIDYVQHFNTEVNLAVLDEIHAMFCQKHPVPDQYEFPLVKPILDTYAFPSFLSSVSSYLTNHRRAKIAHALKDFDRFSSPISFLPADSIGESANDSTLDLIFSQAALEHIDDLPRTYAMCSRWLKPGGLMSHAIDFKCHGISKVWNGHWTYPPIIWRTLMGRRSYFINRRPLSYHLQLLEEHGFEIVLIDKFKQHSVLNRCDLAKEFHSLTEEDFNTAEVYILAQKRP